jgi:dinuclear metal center YbgI/SA1388 family protein
MKAKEIYQIMDKIAPFKYTDKFDNTGFLVGDMEGEVNFIELCLDVTADIIDVSLKIGETGLIISHLPVIFNPLKSVLSGSVVYRLVENKIGYIAAHTNYDVAVGGITDQMADLLQFENTGETLEFVCEEVARDSATDYAINYAVKFYEKFYDKETGKQKSSWEIGYGKICNCEITAQNLVQLSQEKFGSVALKHNLNENSKEKIIRKVGVMSGSGGQLWQDAMAKGCSALIVGEARYNHFVDAYNAGFLLIEAGHYETEVIGMKNLESVLKSELETDNVHFIEKKFIFGV